MSSDESVFGATSHADWAEMVTKLLGGAPPESLNRIDEDGLAVSALYEIDLTVGTEARPAPQLPQAPADRVRYGWDICQPIFLANLQQTTLTAANSSILNALETGASSLWLSSDDDITAVLPTLFDQVLLPAISVIITAPAAAGDVLESLQTLAGDEAVSLHLTHSPVCPSAIATGLSLVDQLGLRGLFMADGWALHNQGHTNIAELAAVLAGVTSVLRAGHVAGHDLAALTSRISLTLALPADMFEGIAKLRAMRQLLTSLFAGLALDPTELPRLIGRPSLRMMSLLDPEENMLRTTTALLGGAIGGADAMVALGHDYLSGESEAARRLARTTQLMMIEESGLARSLDPAGGSAFIENRTDDLASAAWTRFQTIEAQGGLPVFAEAGSLAAWAKAANVKREAALRAGKMQLVGVTLQPAPDDPASLAALPENPIRPAALVEVIRREATATPPRILVLRAEHPDTVQSKREQAVIRLLAIAGLHPVVLGCGADQDAALAAARPDIIISCLDADDSAADALPPEYLFVDAGELLADADQLGRLRAMIAGAAA
jgi:methylmalonyl-CoA mutase